MERFLKPDSAGDDGIPLLIKKFKRILGCVFDDAQINNIYDHCTDAPAIEKENMNNFMERLQA